MLSVYDKVKNILILSFVLFFLSFSIHAENKTIQLIQTECWFDMDETWPSTQCFYMQVPEDYENPNGLWIKFPVLKFEGHDPKAGKSPVLHLGGGGPGNPVGMEPDTIASHIWHNHKGMSIERDRDLYIIDPRGVGMAEPVMVCHGYIQSVIQMYSKPMPESEETALSLEVYKNCMQQARLKGHDLAAYNSLQVAKDIEQLRKQLAIKKWNLYGVSYGSRYALTIAREFPDSVESMVLDGVVFPHIRYDEKMVTDYFSAFERGFAYCRNDKKCRRLFPNLERRFWDIVKELNKKHLPLTITDPYNFKKLDIALTGSRLVSIIFNSLYDMSFYEAFPELIASLEYGNTDLIAEYVRSWMGYQLDTRYGDLSEIGHYCYEEFPFVNYDIPMKQALLHEPVFQQSIHNFIRFRIQECELAKIPPAGEIEIQPVVTEIPTLFLHGKLDPVLPIDDLQDQFRYFKQYDYLFFDDIAHDVVSSSLCAEKAAGLFFDYKLGFATRLDC